MSDLSEERTLYKARCFLCGNFQQKYHDFNLENFYAPVVKQNNNPKLSIKVAKQQVKEGDVENAYLYCYTYKTFIMKQSTDGSQNFYHPGEVFWVQILFGVAWQVAEIW